MVIAEAGMMFVLQGRKTRKIYPRVQGKRRIPWKEGGGGVSERRHRKKKKKKKQKKKRKRRKKKEKKKKKEEEKRLRLDCGCILLDEIDETENDLFVSFNIFQFGE